MPRAEVVLLRERYALPCLTQRVQNMAAAGFLHEQFGDPRAARAASTDPGKRRAVAGVAEFHGSASVPLSVSAWSGRMPA